jgi:hypothetical protein
MKNEISDFFEKNSNSLETILQESKKLLTDGANKNIDERAFILLYLLNIVNSNDILESTLSEEIKTFLTSFIKEEAESIKNFQKIIKSSSFPKLVDLDWKFIGLISIDQGSELIPKILVKLQFNTGESKVFETDFANFKKLQEDIEEGLNSYNSVYSRRVESFSK